MATVEVEPLLVLGKDDDGIEVPINVSLITASNELIHYAMQRALNSYFEQGGLSSDAIRVRIIITDSESNIAGTAITPRENGQIDLEQYSPQHEEIIARRMGPLPPSDS